MSVRAPFEWTEGAYSYNTNTETVSLDMTAYKSEYGLTDAKLNATTGDIAEIYRAFLEQAFIGQAEIAQTQNMQIFKDIQVEDDDSVVQTYTLVVRSGYKNKEVLPEAE